MFNLIILTYLSCSILTSTVYGLTEKECYDAKAVIDATSYIPAKCVEQN